MANDQDVLERLVQTLDLNDQQEKDMLQNSDGGDGEKELAASMLMEVIKEESLQQSSLQDEDSSNSKWADAVPDDGPKPEAIFERAVLMDIQLVYHQGRGMFIKEMAFRGLNCGVMYNINLAHEVADVPTHLVVKRRSGGEQRYYHRYTGLDLMTGDMAYNDQIIVDTLNGVNVVFLKGANKKSTLNDIFDRVNKQEGGGDGSIMTSRPTVVNIDAQTADDEDRLLCKTYGITLAAFSFTYVYANFNAYLNALLDLSNLPICSTEVVHVNNVLARDARYNIFGRGRIICICHNDHSRGGAVKTFGTKQRCSLLNLSILYYLWFGGRYETFVTLARSAVTVAEDKENRETAVTAERVLALRTGLKRQLSRRRRWVPARRFRNDYKYAVHNNRLVSSVHYHPYTTYQKRNDNNDNVNNKYYDARYNDHYYKRDKKRWDHNSRYDAWDESAYGDDNYWYNYV